jgi:hypothetical protein
LIVGLYTNVASGRALDQICKGKSRQVWAIDQKQLAGIALTVLFKSDAAMLIPNSNHCLDAFSVQPPTGDSGTTNKTSAVLEELHARMVRNISNH